MRNVLLITGTAISWATGIAYLVFGFSGHPIEQALDRAYWLVVTVFIVTMLGYIVDSLRNPAVPSEKRRLWAAVLFLGHIFAQPFYWWFYLAPRARSKATAA